MARLTAVALLAAAAVGVLPETGRASDDGAAQTGAIFDLARSLGVSRDETRPLHPYSFDVLGHPMIIGGELSLPVQWRGDFTLVDGPGDDQIKTAPYLQVESIWALSKTLVTFLSLTPQVDTALYREGGGATTNGGVDLSEAWVLATRLFDTPLALQVGRQLLQDEREWWWNQDLDVVRLHYFGRNLTGFIGFGGELGHKSTLAPTPLDDAGVVRVLGNLGWTWASHQTIEAFFLDQSDTSHELVPHRLVAHDPNDQAEANLIWFGLRARGRAKAPFLPRMFYSVDLAGMSGDRITGTFTPVGLAVDLVSNISIRPVRGWAFDTSLTFEAPIKPPVYLTLGYAEGSGRRGADGGLDYGFQQSGLDANAGKFRGLGRFHYYGEVLRPELSNLAVSTVALGIPIARYNSVEILWHNYRQPVADGHIQGSYLGMDPNGADPRLGDEFDLVLSRRPNNAVDIELVTGAFRAGPAFNPREGAWATLVKAKVNLSF